MSGTLIRVLRAEGMHSALRRIHERTSEASRLQAMRMRGWLAQDAQAPLLNVIGMTPAARLGGLPIQLRARLQQEQTLRTVALHHPGCLEVGMRAWRVRDIAEALARTQAGVIHLEGTFGVAIDAVLKLPVDIILSLHDLTLFDEPEAIRRALLQRARTIIFPSEYLRERYGVDGQIIAPGSPAIAAQLEPGMRRRVAYVGSLKRHKGAHLLPDIISATQVTDPEIEWHIFGGGDAELLQPLRRLRQVRLHGYYPAAELPRSLARHRIGLAVLPSIEPESFGLTLSECWSAGVPAITFAHGAHAERIARDGGGWLVPLEMGAAGMAARIAAWMRGGMVSVMPVKTSTAEDAAHAHLALYRELGLPFASTALNRIPLSKAKSSVPTTHPHRCVEDWFGDAFERLHPQLQALHRHGGTLRGAVEIRFGTGIARLAGRFLAHRLGIPVPAADNTLEVNIFSDARGLHWNRRFNWDRDFRSLFIPVGSFPDGHWLERSGPIELALQVELIDGGWHWRPLRSRIFGLTLLHWMLPKTTAHKQFIDGRYQFSVTIGLPLLGTVLSYCGRLDAEPADAMPVPA